MPANMDFSQMMSQMGGPQGQGMQDIDSDSDEDQGCQEDHDHETAHGSTDKPNLDDLEKIEE